jgi:ABC-2 type transport system ATP-binding protein
MEAREEFEEMQNRWRIMEATTIPVGQEYVIETRDLVKIYKEGKVKAVNGLNLRIKKGEIYAFIGANGCGKTTAIKMLTGILDPTTGSIRVLGMEMPKDRKFVSRHIGVAPQDVSLYTDMTVRENVKFFADLAGVNKADFETRFAELMDILKLADRTGTFVANLSGGMKRRVSIACALIHAPRLVFFDEATVGVDPVLRKFFWEYFQRLKENGMTLVVTSHVMDEAERADRIGLMRAGQLIDEGTPGELKDRHGVQSIEEVFLKLSGEAITDE